MNFKTPFKVLTTAALIGTLSLSAVAPGAASASSTSTTQVGAKAATDLQSIILTKEGATPLVVTINEYNTAAALAALDDIDFSKEGLQGYAPASLVTEDGKAYNLAEYNTAVALAELDGPVDPEKIIAELTEVTKPENLTEGSFKDGALEIPESGDFKVTEIAAINPTTVKVNFSKAAEALAKADVTVTNAAGTKQLIKEVKLSDDKKSATVVFYDALKAGDYKVAVKDAGEATLKYAEGEVAEVTADATQTFSTGKNNQKVAYKVLDTAGLDITSLKDVTFESTDASIVDENGNVTATAGSAFVYAVATKTDGTKVKSPRIAVKVEAPQVKEISDFTVGTPNFTDNDYKQVTQVPLESTLTLTALLKDQFGDAIVGAPKFESLDLDVAVVDASNGKITPIKEGKFAVKITAGSVTKTVELEVVAKAKLTSLALDKESVTISNKATVAEKLKLTAKDQNDNDFATDDYSAAYTAAATTEAGKKLVNVSIKADGTIEVTPKADATSGTATVEVKNTADSSVKTTFTVKVDEAGAVADYKVSGFEAKLDKFTANTAKTPATTTLSVIPVDANGAQAGEAVATPIYVVTDKDNKEVKKAGSAIINTDGVVNAADFEVGKYTLTTKVGSVEVSKQEFEVVNTEAQPTVEFTKTEVTDENNDKDLFAEVAAAIKALPGTDAQKALNFTVTGVKFVSSDTAFVASSADAFATAITAEKDGEANLLISEVELTGTGNKKYTVKLDSNFKLAVSSKAFAFAKVVAGTATADDYKTIAETTVTADEASALNKYFAKNAPSDVAEVKAEVKALQEAKEVTPKTVTAHTESGFIKIFFDEFKLTKAGAPFVYSVASGNDITATDADENATNSEPLNFSVGSKTVDTTYVYYVKDKNNKWFKAEYKFTVTDKNLAPA